MSATAIANTRPNYTGLLQSLPEGSTSVPYFIRTPIGDWCLEGFLFTDEVESRFFETLKLFAKSKNLPNGLRLYALSLRRHYHGSLGEMRVEIAKKTARNNLKRVALVKEEQAAVQLQLSEDLQKEQVYHDIPAAKSSRSEPASISASTSTTPAGTSRKTRVKVPTMKRKQAQGINDCHALKRARRLERFQELDPARFWYLKSGRAVEQVLHEASLDEGATVKVRSYTIDFHCQNTQALFTSDEWTEISQGDSFGLPALSLPVINYMSSVRRAMLAGHSACSVPLPDRDSFTCHLIRVSCMTWELLYKKQPSPFAVDDLSESYWARKSWPLLLELLDDAENMYMLDGEKTGIDSSRRRNHGRSWNPEEDIPRKRLGRKLDLIARDVVEQKDWAIVERMKGWDPQSTKFLKESGFDLIREQLTIMHNRLHEAPEDSFKKHARFFGIYTGDRGFQAFELRPADGQSYVTLFHLYHPQELPTNMNDLKVHFRGLTKLLQIRMCLLKTIELYRSCMKATEDEEEQENEGRQEEDDMSWLYEGGRKEDPNVNHFLASSPPCSPDHPCYM